MIKKAITTFTIALIFTLGNTTMYAQVVTNKTGISISTTKGNVIYIGIDNPIDITVDGENIEDIEVTAEGTVVSVLLNTYDQKYIVTARIPGEMALVVKHNKKEYKKHFRIKRIPAPVACLGNKSEGKMGTGEFKAQAGVLALLYNFDYDAKCMIKGFQVIRISKSGEREVTRNIGNKYTDKTKALINKATRGDIFIFDEIQCRCPGDAASRMISPMVFHIR